MKAAKKLQEVVEMFPVDKVQQIRNQVDNYIKQGGVHITTEKSSLEKGLEIASGKALPSDFKKTDEEIAAEEVRKQEENERYVVLSSFL